jgi:PPP family 3-phenylpropionic acid transporter
VTRLSARARSRLAYAGLYTAVGASTPFLALYYQSIGLGFGEIGIIVAIGAIAALSAAPLWGLLSDRLRGSPRVLVLAAGWAVLGTLLLSQANDFVGALVGAILLTSGFAGISPIVDARALERSGTDRRGYGPLRAWGSISYVVGAAGTGAVIDRWGIEAAFVVLAIALATTAAVGSTLRSVAGHHLEPPLMAPERLGPRAAVRALWTPALGLFLVGAFLTFTALAGVQAFLTLRYHQLGAPASLIGISGAVGAAVEVPLMLRFPALQARFGADRLVVIGALVFSLRAFVNAFTSEPAVLVFMAGVGGIGFACFVVGGATYVSRHAPAELAATAQSLFSGVSMGLGQVVAGVAGGAIATVLSLQGLFAASGMLGLIAAVVLGRAILLPAGRPTAALATTRGRVEPPE